MYPTLHKVRLFFIASLLMSVCLLPGSAVNAQSQNIADYVADKIDDFSLTMRVGQYDEREGSKISKDFGSIYKLKGDVKMRYKEENRVRFDGNIGTATYTFIVNNTKQIVRSSIGLKDVRDIGTAPGKRKTLLDVGFLSRGYLAYTEAEFKRMQEVKGINCALFRVSYRDKSQDTSHRLVWIDPKTKITVKKEEYSQQGKLNATYYYLDPKEVSQGIWFPTKVEAWNKQDKKAGDLLYREIKLNVGVEDSIFN